MKTRKPLEISETFKRPQGYKFEPDQPLRAEFRAKSGVSLDAQPTITVFDYIGDEGFSDARMAAALRTIGDTTDVLVEINSPGGDYFQGVAIYNMLQRHAGKVTVQVLGLAASAASLLAMAGDTIQIAKNAEIMIHKAWAITIGNEDDHASTLDTLKHLDLAMADTYAARSGRDQREILKMMAKGGGAGTYFRGEKAVEMGFADTIMDIEAEAVAFAEADDLHASLREWDKRLAKAGVTKSERRTLFKDLRGTQDAAASAMQDAGDKAPAVWLRELANSINS